ncbi:MAG: DeoR family transcriptional regulator, partial [Bifidobacteriaceae bacterium]|nr:DeoR family transcriptional regulator [Bifidobacteriaceae bacterium]
MAHPRNLGATRRRSELLALIRAEGRAPVAGLAERFGVSPETLRRDLRALETLRTVQRAYGTVQAAQSGVFETDLTYRADSNVAEKERIAEAAVARIGEAQTLYLDEGFTPSLVAKRLSGGRPMTV